MTRALPSFLSVVLFTQATGVGLGAGREPDFSPRPEERQLPKRMHSAMSQVARVKVGRADADIAGNDQRALQAAVDYVASLGGGIVEIGPGEYVMRDSLHLRSFVTVRGTPGQTILRKGEGFSSPLAIDGDFGEEQVTLVKADGFEPGCGLAIWDTKAGGFHVTVARITGRHEHTVAIDHSLMADYMVRQGAQAATVFPVISGCDIEAARLEHLIVEGNKEHNVPLDGCRGAGIYLYRGFGTVIDHCEVRNYNGDGISFQQSNDVTVNECVSEKNAALGIHPGSGSQRATVRQCVARQNGTDGLFLCWRVRHGVFEQNVLEANGRYGISIGHKDTDNLLRQNQVRGNGENGICFREESLGMAGHRNRVEDNLIENNGVARESAGIRIRGETQGVVLKGNRIRDTRSADAQRQKTGIEIDEQVGAVTLEDNTVEARVAVKDQRRK